jgi:hypothetical protein
MAALATDEFGLSKSARNNNPMEKKNVDERARAIQGLVILGKSPNDECAICGQAFNQTTGAPVENLVMSDNRLFACGCPGTKNKHVFHEYCLGTWCCTWLKSQHRPESAILNWDTAGAPCPECRGPMGLGKNRIKLVGPYVTDQSGDRGGRRKSRRKSRRLKKTRRR